MKFTKENINKYLSELSDELESKSIKGEILIVGGAAMILSFNSRPSTKDIDAIFKPKKEFREAVLKVGEREDLSSDWINDAVKGFFFSDKFKQNLTLEFENLSVYVPEPSYLLAMKVISMRTEREHSDLADIEILLKELDIRSSEEVFKLVKEYYPDKMIPQRSYYAIEEIVSKVFDKDLDKGMEM